jgi:UDP-N-acetylmuramate dehydrogenase
MQEPTAAPPRSVSGFPVALAGIFRTGTLLADHTTIRLGGPMSLLAEPEDEVLLGQLLAFLHERREPYRILGGGSNLLPPDEPVPDVVIHLSRFLGFAVDGARVRAGAGVALPTLVARLNSLGLAGAEVLAGIPGQVGGAVAMNAGGRYGDIAGITESVRVLLPTGEGTQLSATELDFGYRRCGLPRGAVVVEATLRLRPTADVAALKKASGKILKEKNEAQPTTGWNFGCMFQNPPGESAGRLLDRLGLRGLQVGRARISPQHANFVENLGGAKASEVRQLLEVCEERARAAGVHLEREVRVWLPSTTGPKI